MIKDVIYKNEISVDKGSNKEKGTSNINLIDHRYANDINSNDNITNYTKNNFQAINNEGIIRYEQNPLTNCRENGALNNNLLNMTDNLLGMDSFICPRAQSNMEVKNLTNEIFREDIEDISMFGLEEKATNTEELTSLKIDELLSINDQFLKCKEQFILHCVKNQPDILAKMFPDLFKKQKINVKQNLISGIKRKRDIGFFKTKHNNLTLKKISPNTDEKHDKRFKKERDLKEQDTKSIFSSASEGDKSLNSESPNAEKANVISSGDACNPLDQFVTNNKKIFPLSNTPNSSLFSTKPDETKKTNQINQNNSLNTSETRSNLNNINSNALPNLGLVPEVKKEKRKYKSAAMKSKMALDEAKKSDLSTKVDNLEIKEKENSFSYANKFSEVMEVFNLAMPNRDNQHETKENKNVVITNLIY